MIKDSNITNFIKDSQDNLGDNLVAIVVYGSRFWGYADSLESEWDIFLFLDKPVSKKEEETFRSKHIPPIDGIDIEYFSTTEQALQQVQQGSWSAYIVLLKASETIFKTEKYDQFLERLRLEKPNKRMIAKTYREEKNQFDLEFLIKNKLTGFRAAKWIYHSVNKRLQILTYFRTDRLILDLAENVNLNSELLSDEEQSFLKEMKRKTFSRENRLTPEELELGKQLIIKTGELVQSYELGTV